MDDHALEGFIRDSYLHQGRMEASMKSMESYVGAVSAKVDRVNLRIDAHEDAHKKGAEALLAEQRMEIRELPRHSSAVIIGIGGILVVAIGYFLHR